MDHYKNYSQVHFLKKTIQILLSISVFSLFFFQPSFLAAMLNFLDHYKSTFSIKLFHYKTERNYIFLLFNGILIVILKNSGLISPSPMNSSHKEGKKENIHNSPQVSDEDFSRRKTEVTHKDIKEAEENGRTNGILVTIKSEAEIPQRKTELVEDLNYEEDQVEEKEEEEHELISVDELNRKCDEFIKKMREGIKDESQSIIMV